MQTNHTLGPWYVQDNTSQGAHDQLRVDSDQGCIGIFGRGETVSAELQANARLAAAAPELLEALHSLMWRFEDDDKDADIAQARAAIAKATKATEV